MRPKERLLRRGKVPNDESAMRNALEAWSDRLSHWTEFFTFLVVAGLIVEYLPGITYFLRFIFPTFAVGVKGHAEQLLQFGGFLVIAGVGGELWIEVRASRVETDLRDENARVISRADEQIERLRKENNEFTALLSFRSVGDPEEFVAAMKPFAGTRFAFGIFGLGETRNIHLILNTLLEQAGWIKVREPARRLQAGWGIEIATVGDPGSPMGEGAVALAEWLDRHRVGVIPMVAKPDDIELGAVVITIGPKPETLEIQRMLQESYQLRTARFFAPPQA